MVSAQDKIIYVANKLGLSTLKDMQATTRIVYDQNTTAAGTFTFFEQVNTRTFPNTNIPQNQFEVNECLLVESIDFIIPADATGVAYGPLTTTVAVRFNLIIGNKIVIKDAICELNNAMFTGAVQATYYLEGVGLLIPPQVEFKVEAVVYNPQTRAASTSRLGCVLAGTGVLLNFQNTL
jgi:hypothetical protein